MKLICVQCGKKFELTHGEIDFYRSKGLDLPKRCKDCRNKNSKKYVVTQKEKRPSSLVAAALFFSFGVVGVILGIYEYGAISYFCAIALFFLSLFFYLRRNKTVQYDLSFGDKYTYKFYDANTFLEHYKKHGSDVGCRSIEDYLKAANRVICDKNSLHKTLPDGDKIYYNKKNGDYVVLSHSGYIRTYYKMRYSHFLNQ